MFGIGGPSLGFFIQADAISVEHCIVQPYNCSSVWCSVWSVWFVVSCTVMIDTPCTCLPRPAPPRLLTFKLHCSFSSFDVPSSGPRRSAGSE